MLIYLFIIVLVIHAFIHLTGLVKISGSHSALPLVQNFYRGPALWWLLACMLLLLVAALLLVNNDSWYLIAIGAIIISQVLIIKNWKSAKWGSIINLVILLAAITTFANTRFNKMAATESRTILARAGDKQHPVMTKEMLNDLPAVVQKWLKHAGVIGNKRINTVRLKQRGELRTSQSGKWMAFTASQYFTMDDPAFVWTASVAMMPMVFFDARDKFENGRGASAIKLFAIFDMGSSANDYKTNTASMLRYLAETCLFPSAAISDCIQWQPAGVLSAKAIMTIDGLTVSGIFTFLENGDVESFIADRFYGNGLNARTEPWLIRFTEWRTFQGYRIPVKNKVIWQLPAGDFYWANIEITEVEYNCTKTYD